MILSYDNLLSSNMYQVTIENEINKNRSQRKPQDKPIVDY